MDHRSSQIQLVYPPIFNWYLHHLFNPIVSNFSMFVIPKMSQPYFGQMWGWSPTLGKSEDLESSGTPECLELDSKAQNTLHWSVLHFIEKVLKRRCRKWPRIGHLDICSPSYGQKKGRESNWPLPDLRIESAIRRWKDLDAGYKFGSDLIAIKRRSRELWAPKVPGLHSGQFRDSNLGVPGVPEKSDIRAWVPPKVTEYTIGSMVVAYSRGPGRGVSRGPKCPWLVPTPKGVPECELTTWVVCFDADSSLIY
jgi:hypothetical protein